MNQLVKEAGEVVAINATVLSVATFSNLEVILKILLLAISIAYTIDKWYFQKKKRDGEKKDN
jgi:hypothetical protein